MGATYVKHFNRNLRAISPVLAILMMIAVAMAGSLVVYAWVRGYIDLSTEKSGQAINVHSIANHENDLVVYVQNTGEGVTQLDEAGCLYVNGQMVECKILGVTVSDGFATLAGGETATITYAGGAAPSGEKVEIKVTTQLGAFAEYSDYPAGNPYASILDHFIFDTIESPQTVGVPFSVTIRAIDQYGTRLTTYSGPNMFYSTGNMTAQEGGSWILGIFTFNVTFTDSTTNVTIGTASLSEPSKDGTSNTFSVVDSPVVYSLDST